MPATDESQSDPLAAEQPTRGADRNQDLSADDSGETELSLLPSLDDGTTLLDVSGARGVRVLQSLVLDHLLMNDGPALWIDARGYATSTSLARLAPSQRLLERIHVARGFTPYQHHAAIQRIRDALPSSDDGGERGVAPSLIVAPALDAQYDDGDTLHAEYGETLQARSLALLSRYSRQYGTPVLVTRTDRNEFTASIEAAADHHLECEQTKLGPRFSGEDFTTLLYPDGDAFYQTTLAFWRQVLGDRASQLGIEPASPGSTATSEPGIGSGVLADGTSQSFTVDPLVDSRRGSGWGR
jgi:hypothetical protein